MSVRSVLSPGTHCFLDLSEGNTPSVCLGLKFSAIPWGFRKYPGISTNRAVALTWRSGGAGSVLLRAFSHALINILLQCLFCQ